MSNQQQQPRLPILQYEEKIIDAVEHNPVVVIIGETGSGKSTQLSQILDRRGYTNSGIIGVTQPRRVAAVSVSRRVCQEVGVKIGDEVGYSIRFEDRTSRKTKIKYVTDGVLIRESLSDPELSEYSVIILDEAHERSLNTDVLLGLMKRLVKRRGSNLKVVITSATMDGNKVSKFFWNCPVLNVPGKLYPVEIVYSQVNPKSYVESALRKAIDIHVNEPEGDVLIFMTGQEDIDKLVAKLGNTVASLEEGSCMDAIILPLHGSLPPEMQLRVFSPCPPNCRRFIVATNIAETSLTVDGVVYVIDAGYVKQRQYNPSSGMYSLDVVPISRVQADQRAGRAGRTRGGKCYRLYPELVYQEEFVAATIPEIQRCSLAGTVLYLKSLQLSDIDILKFDFMDPPSTDSLMDALKQLYLIDAIDECGAITRIGTSMAQIPLEPSLSRTLIEANEYGCLSEALTVAAMLSAETTTTLRITKQQYIDKKKKNKKRKHNSISSTRSSSSSYYDDEEEDVIIPGGADGNGLGDHIQLLQIFEHWHETGYDVSWCKDNNLQVRGMMFARDVRKQLSQIMEEKIIGRGSTTTDLVDIQSNVVGMNKYRMLRKALCVGYANQVADRMSLHNGYRPLGFTSRLVQVHPSSVLKTDDQGLYPDSVVFHELVSTSRPYMRNVCSVEMGWLTSTRDKLNKIDINKLSGGRIERSCSEIQPSSVAPLNHDHLRETAIKAARDRFLARRRILSCCNGRSKNQTSPQLVLP